MFRRVLIANRGEIACRVAKTLARLGIDAVAVYSDVDRHAPHVRAAAESVALGAAPAAQSYLDQGKILAAARSSGAEAIHPGYGFLSENADFAEAVGAAGLVFIGPTPDQMRDFGLKHLARLRLAVRHDGRIIVCEAARPAAPRCRARQSRPQSPRCRRPGRAVRPRPWRFCRTP